jgi:hypothetical protein
MHLRCFVLPRELSPLTFFCVSSRPPNDASGLDMASPPPAYPTCIVTSAILTGSSICRSVLGTADHMRLARFFLCKKRSPSLFFLDLHQVLVFFQISTPWVVHVSLSSHPEGRRLGGSGGVTFRVHDPSSTACSEGRFSQSNHPRCYIHDQLKDLGAWKTEANSWASNYGNSSHLPCLMPFF